MVATLIGKTTLARNETVNRAWFVVDADGLVLGRLANDLATILMGKHKRIYTSHVDTGDFVVVINAEKVKITGKKLEQKSHQSYTYHPGGHKYRSWGEVMEKHPERLIEQAVRRMLPKNKIGRTMYKKLKVYRGSEHGHQAQQPVVLDLSERLPKAMETMSA